MHAHLCGHRKRGPERNRNTCTRTRPHGVIKRLPHLPETPTMVRRRFGFTGVCFEPGLRLVICVFRLVLFDSKRFRLVLGSSWGGKLPQEPNKTNSKPNITNLRPDPVQNRPPQSQPYPLPPASPSCAGNRPKIDRDPESIRALEVRSLLPLHFGLLNPASGPRAGLPGQVLDVRLM